jgi:hypothetical protein
MTNRPLDTRDAPRRATSTPAAVDLYWLPLGAGGRSVRLNGKVFEAVAARMQHRAPCDLYHAGLEVRVDGERFTIEMAPAWDADGAQRGAVVAGPVGARWAGRSRLFRYEVRCWRDGRIPDIAEAVESPRRLSDDPAAARRLLSLVPAVPALTWGRDELGAGDMWNSNSVVAFLLAGSGIDPTQVRPPTAGRAPSWRAGRAAYACLTDSGTSISRLRILPVGPFGSSSTNQMRRGYL